MNLILQEQRENTGRSKLKPEDGLQIWGGLECTINRVGNEYYDQLEYCGHYYREEDINSISSLGIKMLRYPVLWEKHSSQIDTPVNWSFVERNLLKLKDVGITPIAGLVHHGSGPEYVNFFDGSFENGLAEYAKQVAEKFPWLEYYTPVNEPLTTARFCGLYGIWYPHKKDEYSFYKILLSECKATIMAMKKIREINPDAKLIQTEDLSKCYSTPLLQYQADFENERRWLSYDLLCGTLRPEHTMWKYMLYVGIDENDLIYFIDNNCKPHTAGFNYYVTSERYLDEDRDKYPMQCHGGNGRHLYADTEAVRVPLQTPTGLAVLMREAWQHLQIPLAITECHLHCTREEQMRWFNEVWKTANQLKSEGVDIRAITAWALFGLHGWNCLVTKPRGDYEPGVFNVSSGQLRPTALAKLIQTLAKHQVCHHPVLEADGWWKRSSRLFHSFNNVVQFNTEKRKRTCQPLLIIGKTGTLGSAFSRICNERNIHHLLLSRADIDITNREAIEQVIKKLNPWAIINAAGYVRVDDAEKEPEQCFQSNCGGATFLAEACNKYQIKFITFSSDLVFDGSKNEPYVESDPVNPLSIYGQSKAKAEENILSHNPNALVIRTCGFFGPWDEYNFISTTLASFKQGRQVHVAKDVFVSPTYVPDLVNVCLDLTLDDEEGIFHITNQGRTTWADFAYKVAELSAYDAALIRAVPLIEMHLKAPRPYYSVLESEKGIKLRTFENAVENYFEATGNLYLPRSIAV